MDWTVVRSEPRGRQVAHVYRSDSRMVTVRTDGPPPSQDECDAAWNMAVNKWKAKVGK